MNEVTGPGYRLILGDCLDVLPGLGKVDAVVTDPPYGCGKADWDDRFPVAWYGAARRFGAMIAIITGSSGLKDSVALVGEDFIDVIAARNLNGMTRSPAGFGNWLSCVVAVEKPPQGVTFFEFSVNGSMPEHPSPKPLSYMVKLIERITSFGDLVLDPFAGSGTTGVACLQTGRRFIGVELDPTYHAIAARRLADAAAQPMLIPSVESEPMPVQAVLHMEVR